MELQEFMPGLIDYCVDADRCRQCGFIEDLDGRHDDDNDGNVTGYNGFLWEP